MDILKNAIAKKYFFKKYSAKFPKMFQTQKRFLSKKLSLIKNKEIYHIGSTAVPNLGGKGIIDIIIVVPKKSFSKARKLLEKSGFVYDHTMRKKRSFFYKYYVSSGSAKLIHLHLTFRGSGEIEKALAFRDYLCANKKARKDYTKLKKRASHLYSNHGKKYLKYKFSFVRGILKKVLK